MDFTQNFTHFHPFDAIVYLKKLDSGKPAELSEMLPFLYNETPETPIYSVFTGADIFYGDIKHIINTLNPNIVLPNSVKYLKGDIFKDKVIKCMKGGTEYKNLKLDIYLNNISIMCLSEKKKIRKKFIASNIFNISRLFASIVSDASNNIAFLTTEPDYQNIEDVIESFIKSLFQEASIDWSSTSLYHGQTVKANYARHKRSESKGFYGSYNHLWSSLLYDAYTNVALENAKNFHGILAKSPLKIESIIVSMKKDFLGSSFEINTYNKPRSNAFKTILDEMHNSTDEDKKRIYSYSFDNEESGSVRREILTIITDFSKGLNGICEDGGKVIDKFVSLFKEILKEKIANNDKVTVENLYQAYPHLRASLNNWSKSIIDICMEEKVDLVKVSEHFMNIVS